MTILNRPEPSDAERLAILPQLPRDEDGPVFAEPWQAQAFAMAKSKDLMSRDGKYSDGRGKKNQK